MSENGGGKLIIISGPSGAGKSTVVAQLIEQCRDLPLKLSVSATTRPVRGDDSPGKNYIFLSHDEFQRRIENGDFLEYVEVFGRGHLYGTLREQVVIGMQAGNWIILEIDVEGAQKVKNLYPDAITLFIHPGSLDELEKRLRGRGTDNDNDIRRRLEVARLEIEAAVIYDYVVVNQSVDETVEAICRMLSNNATSTSHNS